MLKKNKTILIITLITFTLTLKPTDFCQELLPSIEDKGIQVALDYLIEDNNIQVFLIDNTLFEESFIMNTFGNYYAVKLTNDNFNENFATKFVTEPKAENSNKYHLIFDKATCYTKTFFAENNIYFITKIDVIPIVFINNLLNESEQEIEKKEIFIKFFNILLFGIKEPFEAANPLNIKNTDAVHWFYDKTTNNVSYRNINYTNYGANESLQTIESFFKQILEKVVYEWRAFEIIEGKGVFLGNVLDKKGVGFFGNEVVKEYMEKIKIEANDLMIV